MRSQSLIIKKKTFCDFFFKENLLVYFVFVFGTYRYKDEACLSVVVRTISACLE